MQIMPWDVTHLVLRSGFLLDDGLGISNGVPGSLCWSPRASWGMEPTGQFCCLLNLRLSLALFLANAFRPPMSIP